MTHLPTGQFVLKILVSSWFDLNRFSTSLSCSEKQKLAAYDWLTPGNRNSSLCRPGVAAIPRVFGLNVTDTSYARNASFGTSNGVSIFVPLSNNPNSSSDRS